MEAPSLWVVVLVIIGFIILVAGLAFLWRWYLYRSLPPNIHARRPFSTLGKVHALSYVICMIVGFIMVGAFPESWLARLLGVHGPFIFLLVVITPAVLLGIILEFRGLKLHIDQSDDV